MQTGLSYRAIRGTLTALLLLSTEMLMSCHKEVITSESTSSSAKSRMEAGSSSLNATSFADETLYREVWNSISGNDIAQVPQSATPTSKAEISGLEGPLNSGINYAARIRGYITAPATGEYTFWIAADDSGELWLSTSEDPDDKVKIAYTLSWTFSRQWTKFSTQQSAVINLQEGQKYYIEVLHKQGRGGANLAVQWKLPDGTVESPIPASRLSGYTEPEDTSYVNSPAIYLEGKHDVTISGKYITGGTDPLIVLKNCYNIHITGNKLANSSQVGIYLYQCKGITIDNNFITNVSTGVYADQSDGGGIVVNENQFLNMKGPFPRGQFVQFNNVKGPNSSISNNRGENIMGQSYPEDAISLYQSEGTASSPITISGNWIRGGGPSRSGGGIMLGDNGGAYLTATDNILVNPGQFGMAISGGDHNSIINNTIFGSRQYFTNVGLYVNDINGYKTTNCTVSGNKVRFYNAVYYQNNAWLSPGSNRPAGWDTNIFGASLDTSILPAVIITKR